MQQMLPFLQSFSVSSCIIHYHPVLCLDIRRMRYLPSIPVVFISILPPLKPRVPLHQLLEDLWPWPWLFRLMALGSGDDQMPHGSNWNQLSTNAPRKKMKKTLFFSKLRTESLSLVNPQKYIMQLATQKAVACLCVFPISLFPPYRFGSTWASGSPNADDRYVVCTRFRSERCVAA